MVCRETRELGDRRRAFHPPPLLSLALRLFCLLCTCLTLTPHTYSPGIKAWRMKGAQMQKREMDINMKGKRDFRVKRGSQTWTENESCKGQKARGTPPPSLLDLTGEGTATQVGLSLRSLYTADTLSPSCHLLFGFSFSVGVTALQGCKLCIGGSKGQEHTSLTADVTV